MNNYKIFIFIIGFVLLVSGCSSGAADSAQSGANTGRSGSLARFAQVQDTLYVLSGATLRLLRIDDPATPEIWSQVEVPWDAETLLALDEYLFIGAASGMHIYDIQQPLFPEKVSDLVHARACDPVVVQPPYAYVTLRSNAGTCGSASNQLDIIDIQDIENPVLIRSYPMENPAGLGVLSDNLFVCDGLAGLKRLSVFDPEQIEVIESDSSIQCHDLIVTPKLLIAIGENTLYQFDHQVSPMGWLSQIHTVNTEVELQ